MTQEITEEFQAGWQEGRNSIEVEVGALRAEVARLRAEVERLRAAIRWALGEAPDVDGNWFGDETPPLEAKFWWRQKLRAALEPKPWTEDEIERLRLRVKFLEDELKCPSALEPKP